jgi:nucleoid-associated protein YgaU
MATITVTSTTLFQIACQYYDDPTQWDRIATLNDIDDPWLSGLTTLILPSLETATGGVIGFG